MLTAGVVGIAAVLVLMFEIITISDSYRTITDEYFENTKYASDIRTLLHKHQALVGNHVSASDEEQYIYYENEAKITEAQIKSAFSQFGKRMSGGDRERIYHNAYTEFLSYMQNAENAMTFSRAGNKGTADYYVVAIMYGHVQKVNAAFDELDDFTAKEISDAKEQMNNYINISVFSAVVSIVLIAVSVAVTSVYCFRLALKAEEAANSANEANKAKSDFLAMMSHEIRTPLNAVIGMNEMMLQESGEETVLTYAYKASSAGRTLLSIINNILDISKIEAGKMEITEDEYDLSVLVYDCYNLTSYRAEKKGLTLSYHAFEKLPSRLYGDMFHIRQIAVNFITNAIKYTDKGGVEISFSGEDTENGFALRISVKDSGIGIDEESKKKLFTSFQRFDMKRNANVEGTGLGLAICKQLAELMNGTIEVESEYGKGSVFSIVVPQKIADSTPVGNISQINLQHGQKEHIENLNFKNARVLAVDDFDMNLFVFKNLVKNTGISVDTAQSGSECLKLVKEKEYDIIFLDHMMPEMDGIETFHNMKKLGDYKNSNTPVIMLTANAVNGIKDRYIAEGFSGYLSKPVEKDMLNKILLKYLPDKKTVGEDVGEKSVRDEKDITEKNVENTTADNRFKVLKEAFPDVKTEVGLVYCSNSEDFYIELLKDLAALQKKNELQTAYDGADWKMYGIKAHALKGVAKMLGLENMREVFEDLQKAAENTDAEYIENNHGRAVSMLDKLAECVCEM